MTGHTWGHIPGGVGLRHLLSKLAGKMLLITVHVLPIVLFLCWPSPSPPTANSLI